MCSLVSGVGKNLNLRDCPARRCQPVVQPSQEPGSALSRLRPQSLRGTLVCNYNEQEWTTNVTAPHSLKTGGTATTSGGPKGFSGLLLTGILRQGQRHD